LSYRHVASVIFIGTPLALHRIEMRSIPTQQNRPLCLLGLLWAILLLLARVAEGRVPFPPVAEAPEFAWDRQTFFRYLPEWNMDSPNFPWVPTPEEIRNAESDPRSVAASLFREAQAKVRAGGNAEEAARLYMRAYAADRSGEIGFVAMKQAARFFFRARKYMEASGILDRLIERSGSGGTPFHLLKGEALARLGNHLAARESLRRASGGKWDPLTQRRIALRIADMSFLVGNIAYAEPLYRKLLAGKDAPVQFPYESIRFGETLLSIGRIEEALGVFRRLRADALPLEARCASFLGEGDALLLRNDFAGARYAYEQAAGRESPAIRWWILLRKADIEYAAGSREAASVQYRNLAGCPLPDVAREAAYKSILVRFLLSDYESVLKESQAYLGRFAGKSDEAAIRKMSARAGAALVEEIGRKSPADRWPALTENLFAFGRSPEGKTLYGAIGAEWEAALLWGGASDLYRVAGETARSRNMLRIEAAERRYWQGDLIGSAAELDIRNPATEQSRPALRLLARIRFREGKFAEAGKLLRRIETLGTGPGAVKESGVTPEKEFLAFTQALQGKWTESLDALQGVDPASAPPPVRGLRSMIGHHTPVDANAPATAAKPGAAPAPNDLYSAYERTQDRYHRLMAQGAE
jgi:predicted negative regulator of RcsB-dependent stress response